MTRQEAIEAAAELMTGRDCGSDSLAALGVVGGVRWASWGEGDSWGELAWIVLGMTGRTDLADAIWEGR